MPAISQCVRFRAKSKLSRRQWLQSAALIQAAAPCLSAWPDAAAAGAKSPPLSVPTIDGNTIEVHKQPGKVVLVDFMTTTCPSCKKASEGIQALYRDLGGKGFLPVAIAMDSQAASLLPFYRSLHRLTFPVGIVAREEVLRYLGHPADKPLYVPILVLLDKQGRISVKEVGWIGEQRLRSAVTGLLNEKT